MKTDAELVALLSGIAKVSNKLARTVSDEQLSNTLLSMSERAECMADGKMVGMDNDEIAVLLYRKGLLSIDELKRSLSR